MKNDIDNKWKLVSTQNSYGQDCLVVEYDGETIARINNSGEFAVQKFVTVDETL